MKAILTSNFNQKWVFIRKLHILILESHLEYNNPTGTSDFNRNYHCVLVLSFEINLGVQNAFKKKSNKICVFFIAESESTIKNSHISFKKTFYLFVSLSFPSRSWLYRQSIEDPRFPICSAASIAQKHFYSIQTVGWVI